MLFTYSNWWYLQACPAVLPGFTPLFPHKKDLKTTLVYINKISYRKFPQNGFETRSDLDSTLVHVPNNDDSEKRWRTDDKLTNIPSFFFAEKYRCMNKRICFLWLLTGDTVYSVSKLLLLTGAINTLTGAKTMTSDTF